MAGLTQTEQQATLDARFPTTGAVEWAPGQIAITLD